MIWDRFQGLPGSVDLQDPQENKMWFTCGPMWHCGLERHSALLCARMSSSESQLLSVANDMLSFAWSKGCALLRMTIEDAQIRDTLNLACASGRSCQAKPDLQCCATPMILLPQVYVGHFDEDYNPS